MIQFIASRFYTEQINRNSKGMIQQGEYNQEVVYIKQLNPQLK